MRTTLVSICDLKCVRSWSGIPYHAAKALSQEFPQLRYIDSLKEKNSLFFKVKQAAYRYFLNKRYLRDREPQILRSYSHQINKHSQTSETDVILSLSTILITHLESSVPVVVWTDATFGGMLDFYPEFSNLAEETLRNGHLMEQQALDKCSLIVYSSDWAAQTAINIYNADPAKIKVIPFGANVECNRTREEVSTIVDRRSTDLCKLLFLGVDWYRKGGDVALQVVKSLNARGILAELTVIGCQPTSSEPIPDFVKVLGFVSKSTQEGRNCIDQNLAESHFLILPTLADCTPVVFCEANSWGVPCLASNVGGIPTIIKDDINGKVFPVDVSVEKYCEYISDKFLDYQQYQKLALSSFDEYSTRLNWSASCKKLREFIEDLFAK